MTLVDQASRAFQARFGRCPDWAAQAPGRVNLIGDHIDYNDGIVLPLAIDRHTVIVGAKTRTESLYQFHLPERDEIFSTPQIDIEVNNPEWTKYISGVLLQFRQLGVDIPPFQCSIVSNLPIGAGLSSSAALEVAVATLVEQITGHPLLPMDKAKLCQRAENQSVQVPCGLMDQASTTLCHAGHILKLDCRDESISHLPFSPAGVAVLITNSMVRHSLVSGAYADRKKESATAAELLGLSSWRDLDPRQYDQLAESLPTQLARRGRHITTEMERTQQASQLILDQQWESLGRLMNQSHDSLRDQFQVSCPELDLLVDFTSNLPGVLGTRMTGGGFGGCTVSLIQMHERPFIERAISTKYLAATGMEPEMFVSAAVQGAQVIRT